VPAGEPGGSPAPRLGGSLRSDGRCEFLVWAPRAGRLELRLLSRGERTLPLERGERGYHHGLVADVAPGDLYLYRFEDGRERPDPASRSQPEGVHGPSAVVDRRFPWSDEAWSGLALSDFVFYELHVGTFSPEGTFDAVIPRLSELARLGVTAVELMPVGQFPGSRNWGYDGVGLFAAQDSYGGPEGLKRLVDACHRAGLAVVLDVVYNHLGPEGNYLAEFGPYFADRYRTPWGPALNFDGRKSDEVRRFFLENALSWVCDFHFDALRLDAVHAIFDRSAYPFLEELTDTVHAEAARLGRAVHVIAENDLNDARLILPKNRGGYAMDAQWNDDFHHALHALITGERNGYYRDFGGIGPLARSFAGAYVYCGQYSAFRARRHGNSPEGLAGEKFIVFAQNHDQVGNRMFGERLSQLVDFERVKLAAGAILIAPYLPLFFMGEEYGETAPFLYFLSHGDPVLVEAVRRGRREEFAGFEWSATPPDPQAEETFLRSKLDRSLAEGEPHRSLLAFYRELLRLRREQRSLRSPDRERIEVQAFETEGALVVRRWSEREQILALFHFGETPAEITVWLPFGLWRKLLDSADSRWNGPGGKAPEGFETGEAGVSILLSPLSLALFLLQPAGS
jgi:maltooligosyltrehalose trehalohydrolase